MIRLGFSAALALLVALVASCGGSSGGGSTATLPAPTATRTGPTVSVNPRSGPPGTEITISGSGWPAGVVVTLTGERPDAEAYTTVLTDQSGSFRKSFFIEKKPDGSSLETGRFDLIAVTGSTRVQIPFLVEVRRPVPGPGPGG